MTVSTASAISGKIKSVAAAFLFGAAGLAQACLERYKALLEHVERMWADACEFYTRGNYPFAAFFSILVIEEIGKLSRLAEDLMHYDLPRAAAQSGTVERSHRRKHFMGVVSGALINARLERVLAQLRRFDPPFRDFRRASD